MYFSLLNFTFFRKRVGGALNYHYDPAFPSLLPPLKNWGTPGISSFWLKTATATPFCVSFGESPPGHPHLRTSCQEAPKYFSLKTCSCSFCHLTNSVVNLSIFDQGQKIWGESQTAKAHMKCQRRKETKCFRRLIFSWTRNVSISVSTYCYMAGNI